MLVLTRKANQQVRLGDDITITILRINQGSIRIGIEAPRDVRVLRAEIEPFADQVGNDQVASASNQQSDTAGPKIHSDLNSPAAIDSSDDTCRFEMELTDVVLTNADVELTEDELIELVDQLQAEDTTADEATAPQVYQMRTRRLNAPATSSSPVIAGEAGDGEPAQNGRNSRVTGGRPAPLARFLPQIPPTVREAASGYSY